MLLVAGSDSVCWYILGVSMKELGSVMLSGIGIKLLSVGSGSICDDNTEFLGFTFS
jgi:hypothetical protein